MSKGWVRFRTDTALDDRLDEEAERLSDVLLEYGIQPSRSTVARYILDRELRHPLSKTALRESLKNVHAIVQRATNRAVNEVLELLPQYIEEELDE